MRKNVRAIIIHGDKLLVMYRNKFGDRYVTLPGGGIDTGESLVQALYREVAEETMVNVDKPRLVFIEHAGEPFGDQYIYLCQYVDGHPALHPDSEEAHDNKCGQNLYEPAWVKIKNLQTMPLRPERLKKAILSGWQVGWPQKTVELTG